MADDQYKKLGVDSDKSGVKTAFAGAVENKYPSAFVSIVDDPWTPGWVMTKHADGSGSKSVTHYLFYLETGSDRYMRYDAADGIAMGADIVAAGFTGIQVLTDTLGINQLNVDKNLVVKNVRIGVEETIKLLAAYGFSVKDGGFRVKSVRFLGGETADLPDQITNYVFDADLFSRMPEENVIAGNVMPGDKIWGFASNGRAVWEEMENSGLMSNGSTLGHTALLSEEYNRKYPFLRPSSKFRGQFRVNEYLASLKMSVGQMLLCPTRQWGIIMKMVIDELKDIGHFDKLHAIVMNTGGGLTKCNHVGEGIRYTKKIPTPPLAFQLIQRITEETWFNMAKTFNCGIGAEFIGDSSGGHLQKVISRVSELTRVAWFELGDCTLSETVGKNEVELLTPYGSLGPYIPSS